MSADNWGVCPRCKAKAAKDAEVRIRKARDAYGKVTPEAYEALRQDALVEREPSAALREDYEVFVDEDGLFFVTYSCNCRECGFSHEFKYEEQLKP